MNAIYDLWALIMNSTVMIENVLLLLATAYAFNKYRLEPYLILLIANLGYMYFDYIIFNSLDVTSNHGNMIYYMLNAAFYICMFGLFMTNITYITLILGSCMLIQALLSWLIGVNGAVLGSVTLPNYDIIYTIHALVNSMIWVVEILVVLNVEVRKGMDAITTKL